MRRILWWFRKELREQRVFLVILALAIPVGSWVVAFLGRGVPEGSAATAAQAISDLPHRMNRNGEWMGMLLVSLALVVLTTPGGLFASDARRGCNALTARTPGAWTAAFVGKLGALLTLMLGTLLVHGIVLGRLAVMYRLTEFGQPVDVVWLGPSRPEGMHAILGLFALAPLLVLASVALPWLGVPTVAGVALAAVLALPTLLWFDSSPFFLEAWLGGPRPLFLVAALASVLIAAWTWFRSARRGASPRRVALGSLVALAVVGLGTHALGWAARERYLDFTPGQSDVELEVVGIGPNGHFAFVNAYRGDPSPEPQLGFRQRGTRSKPFILDLQSGVPRATGGSLFYDFPPHRGLGNGLPCFVIPELPEWGPRQLERVQHWYDADTAQVVAREAASRPSAPAAVLQRLDEALRAHTRQRTKEGRPVWIGEGGLTRVVWQEGKGEVIEVRPLHLTLQWSGVGTVRDIPGGWELRWGGNGMIASVDAETGLARFGAPDEHLVRGLRSNGWLSPREILIHPASADRGAFSPAAWRVLDLDTKQERPVVEPAAGVAAQLLGVIDARRVLVLLRHVEPKTLAVYDPGTGALQPVGWDGSVPGPIKAAWPLSHNAVQTATGPLLAVRLLVPGRNGLDVAVFDGASGSARLAPQEFSRSSPQPDVLGFSPDGALWLLEDARRIVRLSPRLLEREVLFPRAR